MDEHGRPSSFGAESTAFGIGRSGVDSELVPLLNARRAIPPRWFSPGRWLAR
jgi:hypothetical protein